QIILYSPTRRSSDLAAKYISRNAKVPSALFSFNDEMAIGIYEYLSHTKLEVGKDIIIIGFDNIEISRYLQPGLTTIGYSRNHWRSEEHTSELQSRFD